MLSSRRQSLYDTSRPKLQSRHDLDNYYFRHDTVMFHNIDLLRSADLSFVLAMFYLGCAFVLPHLSPGQQIAAVTVNALGWRVIHTFVLGNILKAQSEKKWMIRHFLKHYHYEEVGFGATEEAFNNWKGIYNMSLCMVYASFGLLALKCYDWSLTTETLRHTLGLLLIAVHIWTAKAIYDVLGRFGWFYGDFFIQGEGAPLQLYYTGIYRHVNNPERIMGGAAFFGLALLSGSKLVGTVAVLSVLSHFWFLSCVEGPHMKRLYGNTMRKEAGVTKTFRGVANKNSHRAPPQVKRAVQEFQGTLERVFDDTTLAVEEFLRNSAPKLNDYVQNTKVLLKEQGERLLITRVSNVTALDSSAYSLALEPSELVNTADEPTLPDLPQAAKTMPQYHFGETITVKWSAASNCSRRDWVGLYRLGANKSKLVTRVRSQGRWNGIYPDEWDGDTSLAVEGASGSQGPDGPLKRGTLRFTGKKLFWKPGQYEFRYHHDGKHSVMAVSEPFEVVVERPRSVQDFQAVYSTLLPLVSRSLENDPELIPETAIPLLPEEERPSEEGIAKIQAERTDPDDFVIFTTEQADRISEAIAASCGLELTSEVVVAEANVAKLARSVVDSDKILQPFDSNLSIVRRIPEKHGLRRPVAPKRRKIGQTEVILSKGDASELRGRT